MKRIKLFFALFFRQAPPDCLQNACRLNLGRSWRYSKCINGEQVLSLVKCAICNGTGKVYGDRCPRCEGEKTVEMLNPTTFKAAAQLRSEGK